MTLRAQSTDTTPALVTPAAPSLQRACECGKPAGVSGGCASCASAQALGVQAKLTISEPGDRFEREADRVADQVVGTQQATGSSVGEVAPPIQREMNEAVEEEVVQAKVQHNVPSLAPPSGFASELAAASGGQALPSSARETYEPHIGRELSDVRIHADTQANDLASEIEAKAFTHRNHVFFRAGHYEPETTAGKHLLAHELAHVAQQSPSADSVQRKPDRDAKRAARQAKKAARKQKKADKKEARKAKKAAKKQARQSKKDAKRAGKNAEAAGKEPTYAEFAAALTAMATKFAKKTDTAPDDVLAELATGFNDASDSLTDAEITKLEEVYTAAIKIVLESLTRASENAINDPPLMHELYEEHRDVILDVALPKHKGDAGASELRQEASAELPDGASRGDRARHRELGRATGQVTVLTGDVNFENLQGLLNGDSSGGNLPDNTAVKFASNIVKEVKAGLTNVAASLVPDPLAANTTIMLALDTTRVGGDYSTFRFTHLDLGDDLGTEVLVERQGSVGVEGLTDASRKPLLEHFKQVGFKEGSGFDQDEFDQVLIGVSQLPASNLSTVSGLTFDRVAVGDDPQAGAEYDRTTHTVNMFDKAYNSSLTRLGDADQPLTTAASSVVHEVGHAIDLTPLRNTANATEVAQDAMLQDFGTGGTNYEIPHRRDPRRARFDQLNAPLQQAQQNEAAATGPSGVRFGQENGVTVEVDRRRRGADRPAFRTAAIADGANARTGADFPTNYPNPDSYWQEYFAESFALYQNSPDLLAQIRPAVFAYMQTTFPKS